MLRVTSGIAHTHEDSASPAEFTLVMVTVRAGRYGGSPGHPTGASPVGLPPGPNSLFKRGVNDRRGGGRSFLCRAVVISGAAPGTTCGNHRANYPRHLRASSGMVFAVQMHERARKAGRNPYLIPPYKRGGTGSNPVAPTRYSQLGGLFEMLIAEPSNHSREPPVHPSWYGGGCPRARQHPLTLGPSTWALGFRTLGRSDARTHRGRRDRPRRGRHAGPGGPGMSAATRALADQASCHN